MKNFKRFSTIAMLALGLTAVSAKAYAEPICVYANYPAVLEIGQVGAPGSPILIGGYLVSYAYIQGEYQKIPIVGNITWSTDGSVRLGWTSHFDFGSENWGCPVGDTVLTLDGGDFISDTTYHGGDPVDSSCPNNILQEAEVISCEGLYPFDPGLINSAAQGSNSAAK